MPDEVYEYLRITKLCDFDREIVIRKAEEITSGAKNNREKSSRILDFWKNGVKFEYGDWDVSASEALERGRAMCAAKNIGSVAMHRYLGIPARPQLLRFDSESKLWEYAARWDLWLAEKTRLLGRRRDHVVHEVYLAGRWERHDTTRDSALEAGMRVYGIPLESDIVPEEVQVSDFDKWAFERQEKVHIRANERAEFHQRINSLVQIIRETGELVRDRESDANELA